MAEIPTFTAKAPRKGQIMVGGDTGAEAGFAALAQVTSQLAGRLTQKAAQNAKRNATEAGAASAMSVQMPGVDFAFAPGTGAAGTGAAASPEVAKLESYIRESATKRGIDPEIAVRVARSEGLAPGVWQSNVVRNGKRETSYGPFQLLVGGGLGDQFLKQYGKSPADPSTVLQQIDFALDQAATGGWGPWYGAAKVGVGNRTGLANARAIGAAGAPPFRMPTRPGQKIVRPAPAAAPIVPATDVPIVTLTGAAGPLPRQTPGTISGDAFNAAAQDVYLNRLDTSLRAQVEALAIQHEGNPAALSEALDALKSGYISDLPGPAAALMLQSFETQKFAAMRGATREMQKRVQDQNLASFDENIEARITGALRIASKAGTDPEADSRLTAELAQIDAQIDAAPMTALQKSRMKRETSAGVVSARILAGLDALPDAAARDAYTKQVQDEWQEGTGFGGRLDAASFEKVNAELLRRSQADAVAAAKQAAAVDKSIEGQIGFLKKGFPVGQAARDELRRQADLLGDPAVSANLAFLDSLADWQKAYVTRPPQAIDAQIASLRQRIAEEGATPAALTTLDVMETLRGEMTKQLASDPLTFADRAGVTKVEPLDFSDATKLTASLSERVADAAAVAGHYGVPAKFFTPGETDALKKMLAETPLALPSIVSGLAAGLGPDTPKAMAELSADAPILAHVAGLQANTGSQRATVEIAEALEMRRMPGYKSALPTPAAQADLAAETLGPALAALPGTRHAALETAAALFERRAAARGIPTDDFKEEGSAARALYAQALDEALGATMRDGVKYGGVAVVNGVQTIAPPDIPADALDGMIANIAAADLADQPAIGSANGVPISLSALRNGTLVAAGNGRYRIATGDMASGEPAYVPTAAGDYFELDIAALKRSQQRRGQEPGMSATDYFGSGFRAVAP